MGGKNPWGRGGEGKELETDRHKILRIPGGAHVQNYVYIVCLSHVGTLFIESLEAEWIEKEIF